MSADPSPSPQALRLNAIITRALRAAQAAFNEVLLSDGVAALDDSYQLEVSLKFTQRVEPEPEPEPERRLVAPEFNATKCSSPKVGGGFGELCDRPATRYLRINRDGDLAPYCDSCRAE